MPEFFVGITIRPKHAGLGPITRTECVQAPSLDAASRIVIAAIRLIPELKERPDAQPR